MADISTTAHIPADIFQAIMDNGPLTLYSANVKTKIPIGTIHRYFKILNNSGKIRVYESKTKGRKKIEYGPTMYGIIVHYTQDKAFAEKIENYFLLWIEHKEFQKDLAKEGFDISTENLKKSKHLFKKYLDYFGAVEDQIIKIRKGEDSISHDILIMLSSQILSSNPQYQKLLMELYDKIPGMQKSLEGYMENMVKSYDEFKKFKKQSEKTKQQVQKT